MKKSSILLFILTPILIIFIIINLNLNIQKNNLKTQNSNIESMYKLQNKYLEFQKFSRNIGSDLLFLSELSTITSLINSKTSNEFNNNSIKVTNDFKNLISENAQIYQIRYINNLGIEKIKLQKTPNSPLKIFPKIELQNKSLRPYINKTLKLSKSDIYISKIDLNIENQKLETITKNGITNYVPMIRFAIPLFDKNNNSKGLIIINLYMDYYLDLIRFEKSKDSNMILIDNLGNYLANQNRSKEFGNILNISENFFTDYPTIPKTILTENLIEYKILNKTFKIKYIYPTLKSFEIYEGSKKNYGTNSENNYFLAIIHIQNN